MDEKHSLPIPYMYVYDANCQLEAFYRNSPSNANESNRHIRL